MTSLRSLFAIAALAAAIALAPPALGADAAKTVICKDGATAQGGRGACRGHGGVDKAATARAEGGAAAAGAGQKASQADDGPRGQPQRGGCCRGACLRGPRAPR